MFRVVIAFATITAFIIWTLPIRVEAAAGELDPSFGNGGKVTTDISDGSDDARAIALQADGKLVVAGFALNNVVPGDFGVARYNTDGSLDSSFGMGGKVTINITQFESTDVANSIVIQPDGKLVVGGWAALQFALVRLNSDGSLDSTFGSGGKVRTDLSSTSPIRPVNSIINSIALQQDGKIVAAGQRNTFMQNSLDFALARYNSDGSLDPTFGSGGIVTIDFRGLNDAANAVTIQPDGKIIAGGFTDVTTIVQFLFDFAIVRFNSDGSLDASFGVGGKAATNFFGSFDEARSIAIQPDGKLVVGGPATNPFNFPNSGTDFGLVRYNSDGSLDPTFGSGGKVMTDFLSEFDELNALAIQPDGRIIAAGSTEDSEEQTDIALARYNADGTLDVTFGSSGRVITDFFGFDDNGRGLVLRPDGKIVVAGRANISFDHGEFALAQYDGIAFDICLQDDGGANILQINSTTGEYQFAGCSGLALGGTGVLTRKGNTITLQHNAVDRRLSVRIDNSSKRASASIQLLSQGRMVSIIDKNITNNTCACR
jgi:uncharacterized delta-60 repeat protein